MKRIIVTTDPDQQFSILAGSRRITMRLRFNPTTQRWTFDLARDNAWILRGRRIVTGVDLMRGTGIEDVGVIFAHIDKPNAVPDRAGLSSGAVRLYFAEAA